MTISRISRISLLILTLSSIALATTACPEKKGPAERAGEKIDDAVDKAKDAVDDATR